MPAATRTIHPLPFEHLEPKRFEDLVRQLAYDFRPWRQLEPTGRAGSDDGFDIRGYEITDVAAAVEMADQDEDATPPPPMDRLWLIQCKREKAICPTKLVKYLDAIPEGSLEDLHGLIFAAACDFSKKALDAFRSWCSAKGIQEFHLWGRAAIEDCLYQPKNDHLLFAYFGISLQIRRQKVSTSIRRLVSLKRKLNRLLPDAFPGKPIILRDISDDRYPFCDAGKTLIESRCLWLPCYSKGIAREGLRILVRHHMAYYNYEHRQWDFASAVDMAAPYHDDNPRHDVQVRESSPELRQELTQFWRSLPPGGQQHLLWVGHVSYDDIIEIDDVGDDLLKVPTIFVTFKDGRPPFGDRFHLQFYPSRSHMAEAAFHQEGHVRVFPEKFRDLEWERDWFARNHIPYATEPHRYRMATQRAVVFQLRIDHARRARRRPGPSTN